MIKHCCCDTVVPRCQDEITGGNNSAEMGSVIVIIDISRCENGPKTTYLLYSFCQIPEYSICNIPQWTITLDTNKENTKLERSMSFVKVGSKS